MKGSAITIYQMFRTWDLRKTGKWAEEIEALIVKLLDSIEWYFRAPFRLERTSNEVISRQRRTLA